MSIVNIIAISYFDQTTYEGIKLKIFSTEQKAKYWLYEELFVSGIIKGWNDEFGNSYSFPYHSNMLEYILNTPLNDIIIGIDDGSLHICMENIIN
jgi:hypothetical protein